MASLSQRIVIDSSALLAILLGEPEHGLFTEFILQAKVPAISCFSVLETNSVFMGRKGVNGSSWIHSVKIWISGLSRSILNNSIGHDQLGLALGRGVILHA